MNTMLVSLRIDAETISELKALAIEETERRRQHTTWAQLVREGAARTLKAGTRRDAAQNNRGARR